MLLDGLTRDEADVVFDGEAAEHTRASVVTRLTDDGGRTTKWDRTAWWPLHGLHARMLDGWVRSECRRSSLEGTIYDAYGVVRSPLH